MKIKKHFGSFWSIGSGCTVVIDEQGIQVKGTPGQSQAWAPLDSVSTASVTMRKDGPAKMRVSYVQLIGQGAVLGEAGLVTRKPTGMHKAAIEAASWLNAELARRRT